MVAQPVVAGELEDLVVDERSRLAEGTDREAGAEDRYRKPHPAAHAECDERGRSRRQACRQHETAEHEEGRHADIRAPQDRQLRIRQACAPAERRVARVGDQQRRLECQNPVSEHDRDGGYSAQPVQLAIAAGFGHGLTVTCRTYHGRTLMVRRPVSSAGGGGPKHRPRVREGRASVPAPCRSGNKKGWTRRPSPVWRPADRRQVVPGASDLKVLIKWESVTSAKMTFVPSDIVNSTLPAYVPPEIVLTVNASLPYRW